MSTLVVCGNLCTSNCIFCLFLSFFSLCSHVRVCVYIYMFFHWHLYLWLSVCFLIICVPLCVCACLMVCVCSLYVDHLISLLASCALTSIPFLPPLLSLMGNLAMLAWHRAYFLFSCHGYAALWIAPLLPWSCCECYRCLNYQRVELLNIE